MRYIRKSDLRKANKLLDKPLTAHTYVHVTGCVKDMQRVYGWEKVGQVQYGQYVYNVGRSSLQRLRAAKLVHGR